MPLDAKCLKERSGALSQRVFRKYRVTKTRLYQSFDRFRIVGFHYDSGDNPDRLETSIDDLPKIASTRIEKKRNVGKIVGTQDTDVTSSGSLRRAAKNKQFLFK